MKLNICATKLAIMLLCLLLFPVLSRAELVEADLFTPDDKKITLDTTTGLEWLDVTETLGLSFNAALETTLVTDLGFRHATVDELRSLCINAGIDVDSGESASNFAGANNLITLLGCTGNCGGNIPFQFGWMFRDEPGLTYGAEILVKLDRMSGKCTVPSIGQSRGASFGNIGNYLVRQGQTDIDVSIDVKPGSFPNSINPKSNGKIPVAIFSKPDFDAPAAVDTTTLTFGATGNEQSLAFCDKGSEDVNGDGLLDLVCHFTTQLTGFTKGDTEGILRGKTITSTNIVGIDSVRIVP